MNYKTKQFIQIVAQREPFVQYSNKTDPANRCNSNVKIVEKTIQKSISLAGLNQYLVIPLTFCKKDIRSALDL